MSTEPTSHPDLPVSSEGVGRWRSMRDAPMDGRHCILSVPHGAFFYSVQGCYDELRERWVHVLNTDEQPLAWMPNVLLPDEFKPARAAISQATRSEPST